MARSFGRGRGRSPGAPAPRAVFTRRRGGMLGKQAPPRAAPLEPKCRRSRRTRVSEALFVAAQGGSRTCRTCQQGPSNRTNLIGLSVTDSQVSWYDLRIRAADSNRTQFPDRRASQPGGPRLSQPGEGGRRRQLAADGQSIGPSKSSAGPPEDIDKGPRWGVRHSPEASGGFGSGYGSATDPRRIRCHFDGSGRFEWCKHIMFGRILSDHCTLV